MRNKKRIIKLEQDFHSLDLKYGKLRASLVELKNESKACCKEAKAIKTKKVEVENKPKKISKKK